MKRLDVRIGDVVEIDGRRYEVVSNKLGGVALEPAITQTVAGTHVQHSEELEEEPFGAPPSGADRRPVAHSPELDLDDAHRRLAAAAEAAKRLELVGDGREGMVAWERYQAIADAIAAQEHAAEVERRLAARQP